MKLNTTDPTAATRPGDPLWLPMGDPDDPCGSAAPLPPAYGCTRDPGHSGDHAAHTGPHEMVARWSRGEESYPLTEHELLADIDQIATSLGGRPLSDPDDMGRATAPQLRAVVVCLARQFASIWAVLAEKEGYKVVRDGYILEGFVGEVPQLVDRPTFEAQTVEHAAMIAECEGCICKDLTGGDEPGDAGHIVGCPKNVAHRIREALGR